MTLLTKRIADDTTGPASDTVHVSSFDSHGFSGVAQTGDVFAGVRGATAEVFKGAAQGETASMAGAGIMSAGSTLAAGDIAIVSMNADVNKIFAFVALVDINADTVIKFTDNGWTSGGTFRTGEGIITWTAGAGGVTKGTVVTINTTGAVTATTGTVSESGDVNFSTSGDQVLAYQGAEATPTFLFAVNNEGANVWQATAGDTNTSALPTGLTDGATAVALTESDNGAYSGTTTGTRAELLAAIANRANWTMNDTTNQTAPSSFSVSGATVPATVAIDDVSVTEGDAGTQVMTFTVTRSNNTGAFSVDYATADGTATAGSDYDAASGAVSFTAGGALTQTVSVTIHGDTDIESDEGFAVNLSNIVNTTGTASFSDNAGAGTITNNDVPGPGDVSIADITVAENDSGSTVYTLTVTRSGGTSAFTVDFATADGTALSGSDYASTSGTLSFAADELTKTVSVTVNGDVDPEGPPQEYFYVNLSNTSGGAVITDNQAKVTISEDDVAPSTLVINEIDSDTPGSDVAEFVELFDGGAGNTALDGYVLVFYNGSNDLSYAAFDLDGYTTDANGYFVLGNSAVANVDLTFAGNLLQNGADGVALYAGNASSFPNGSSFGAISHLIDAIVYDTDDADDTGLLAGLGQTTQYNENSGGDGTADALARTPNGSGGFVAQGPTPGISNDPMPVLALAISDDTMSENGGLSTATITRSGSTAADLVVTLSSDDTSEATVPVTVTILAGQSSASFDVTAVDDILIDGNQTATVTASATGYVSDNDSIVVNDDDAAYVSIGDVSIVEGNSGDSTLTFTVTRTDNSDAFTIDYATVNGTAAAGSDYEAATGTVSFDVGGALTQTISITVHGDLNAEDAETFLVNLSNVQATEGGAFIADGQATGTINNDDVSYIHDIQGSAFFSPILSDAGIHSYNVNSIQTVTVEAIVTAIDNAGGLQGFFLQEEAGDYDLDWHTSEGIFVMTRNDSNVGTEVDVAAAGLQVGERVQVTAYVVEYQTFENLPRTFLTGVTSIVQSNVITDVPTWVLDGSEAGRIIPNAILSDDNPDFTDAADSVGDTFDAENDALDFFETIEGMHVTIPNMVVADGFVEGSNAEVRFKAYSTDQANPEQINERGGYTIGGENVQYGGANNTDGDVNPDIVELDFSGAGVGGTTGYHNLLDMGDALGDVSGVIDFDFTEVKLYVTDDLTPETVAGLDDQSPVQDVTTLTADARSLRVSTFNVENLAGNADQSRFDAIANAIANHLLAPDIICIEEVQDNNGTTNDGTVDASTTWDRIVTALNTATGKHYQWVDELPVNGAEGGAPGGNIRVGFLYDTDRVQLGNLAADATIAERRQYTDRIGDGVRTSGDLIAYTDADVAGQINSADWTTTRKSLLGQFTFNGNTVFVDANHFPSKGGSDNFWELDQNNTTGNPTNSDWAQRNEVAEDVWSVLDYIADHDANAHIVEGGDFNDFYFYRPLQVATGAVDADGVARGATETRMVNLTVSELAEGERYTYAFDGRNQAIDHLLASEDLAAVADYDIVHLNTGYNARTGAVNPAISDHDPTLGRFDFRSFSEILTGTGAADTLEGFGGADMLLGGLGADTLDGGLGDDTLVVDNSGDVVIERLNEGTDTVRSSIAFDLNLAFYVENLTLTGSTDINATGNARNNGIEGNSGANRIDGGLGNDTMTGGAGNDTYVVAQTGDLVIEAAAGGTDLILSSITWTLAADIENLTLTGTGSPRGIGNALNNTLTGNASANFLYGLDGHDWLDGGAGADNLSGGLGDDSYRVDNAGDVVRENTSEGTDTIFSTVSYSLATLAAVEHLTLERSGNINATGNALANILTGNAGNNQLDGGAGIDSLAGGLGDDTYIYSDTDVITELASQGTDTVKAGVTLTLGDHLENLILSGSAGLKGYGNTLNNALTGNGGANTLYGYDGNDVLDGGLGTDALYGGLGDDSFYVDNAGDAAREYAGEGTDTVFAGLSWSIAAYAALENITLTGSNNIDAVGNSGANVLTGNSGANRLEGGAGIDTLIGGAGDDTYVQREGDIMVELAGQGTDTVLAVNSWTLSDQIENLTLLGTAANTATGNGLDNILTGNAGSNKLIGGLGADRFVFLSGCGADKVLDFQAGQNDLIDIHAYSGGVENGGGVILTTTGNGNTLIDLGGGNTVLVIGVMSDDAGLLSHIIW